MVDRADLEAVLVAADQPRLLAAVARGAKDAKGKREAVIEISKNLDDPSKVEELLSIFEERKKQPIDYRRGGIITLFVGLGLFSLGYFFLGNILRGVGALVGLIGIGVLIAGYLYPNTGEELTDAVEEFEKK